MKTTPSCVATVTIKSRSVISLYYQSRHQPVEIDGSMPFIHVYVLLGIAIKTSNPANSGYEKTLTIAFIRYSKLFEKGDKSDPKAIEN